MRTGGTPISGNLHLLTIYIYNTLYVFYHSGISAVAEKSRVKWMSLVWALDWARELRFWTSSLSHCGGVSSSFAVLIALLSWICGAAVGFCVAAVLISPACRRVLVFVLQGALAVLHPTVLPRTVSLRSRFGEYRD